MYVITEMPRLNESAETRVFSVNQRGASPLVAVQVWWSNGRPYCCDCSGPMSAMSSSCKHAAALRRKFNAARTKEST